MRGGFLVLLCFAVMGPSVANPAAPSPRVAIAGGSAAPATMQSVDAEIQAFVRTGPMSPTIGALGAGEVAVLALNGAPATAAMIAYVGDPAIQPVRLPRGQWWLYVLGADGRIRQSRDVLNISAPARISSLEFGRVDVPGDHSSQAAAMTVLVHFALASQLATWHPVSVLADSRGAASMSRADYDALDGLARAMVTRREAVLQAADVLSQGAVGLEDGPGTVRAASAAGVWDGIKDSFQSFFTSDAMTGASARKDIQALTQSWPPGQREELFQIARQRQGVNAANADEFFRQLGSGAYDSLARQLHQDFIASSENYAIDAASGGRRPIDTAVRDGGQLVQDGAKFYADAIKTVLGARFGSDFDKGWDLAQKIADRLTEVENALKDPAAFARDLALAEVGDQLEAIEGNIKDRMQGRILDALRNAGVSPDEAERLAGEIADRVAEAGKDRIRDAATTIRDQVVLGQVPAATAVPSLEPTTAPAPTPEPAVSTPTEILVPPTPTEAIAAPTAAEVTTVAATATQVRGAGIAFSPSSGSQGTAFQVTGSGFQPGEQVLVSVSPAGSSPGLLTADSRGFVQGLILVSSTDPTGGYTASVVGGTSGARATGSFTVTSGASPTARRQANAAVSPSSGPAGTTFLINGSGFAAGEQVSVNVTFSGGVISAVLASDGFGQASGSMQTNTSDPPGAYTATLSGLSSGAVATVSFLVSPGATATAMALAAPTAVPATSTPSEPYGVFTAGDEVLVGRRSDIENTATCNLRGWGLDCTKKVKDVASVTQVLGPFPTSEGARQAFCGALVPNSWRTVPLGAGSKARFTFSGQELWVNNVSSC